MLGRRLRIQRNLGQRNKPPFVLNYSTLLNQRFNQLISDMADKGLRKRCHERKFPCQVVAFVSSHKQTSPG
jgi:hypothetical protein